MKQVIKILYIEDDPDDVELLQVSLDNHSIPYTMVVVTDGREAIDYLKANHNPHDIIIMDLNLPKVHGRDVLKFIKSGSDIRHLPVIILTTSNNEKEMDEAYKNGAEKYMLKPSTLEAIKLTVDAIVDLVRPPSGYPTLQN